MFRAWRSRSSRLQVMCAPGARPPAPARPAVVEPIERRILLASVSGAVYHDLDADGTRDTGEAGLPGWTVFLDANGNGAFDAAIANSSLSSTDTPRNILDGGTTVSSLSVSGLVGSITDLNVRLYITHTWDADLEVSLIGPDGTRVTLFAAVGGSGDNFGSPTTPTTLDDEAVVSINAGSAPFAGQYRPSGALAGFDGLDPNGNWSLQIVDVTTPDAGILQSWSLDFTLGEPSRVSDAA
ncbi:MAG TPA: proprotein convertase P-domain-containing protein, partial [Tepidisphaeraceae bacterium]|nr:proprotein convertase P-domain-containing protein [Tepidisphaeraceae bacterium]